MAVVKSQLSISIRTRRSILGSDSTTKSDWSLSLWFLSDCSLSILWVPSECSKCSLNACLKLAQCSLKSSCFLACLPACLLDCLPAFLLACLPACQALSWPLSWALPWAFAFCSCLVLRFLLKLIIELSLKLSRVTPVSLLAPEDGDPRLPSCRSQKAIEQKFICALQ